MQVHCSCQQATDGAPTLSRSGHCEVSKGGVVWGLITKSWFCICEWEGQLVVPMQGVMTSLRYRTSYASYYAHAVRLTDHTFCWAVLNVCSWMGAEHVPGFTWSAAISDLHIIVCLQQTLQWTRPRRALHTATHLPALELLPPFRDIAPISWICWRYHQALTHVSFDHETRVIRTCA